MLTLTYTNDTVRTNIQYANILMFGKEKHVFKDTEMAKTVGQMTNIYLLHKLLRDYISNTIGHH